MGWEMDPFYAAQLSNFEDETDMCNQLGLNYDEIYVSTSDDDSSNFND